MGTAWKMSHWLVVVNNICFFSISLYFEQLLFTLSFSLRQWSPITGKSKQPTRGTTFHWAGSPGHYLMLLWCSHVVWLNTWWDLRVASWTWFDTLINLEKCSTFIQLEKFWKSPCAMCLWCFQQIMPAGSFLFINWTRSFHITPQFVVISWVKMVTGKWILPITALKKYWKSLEFFRFPQATVWYLFFCDCFPYEAWPWVSIPCI